MKFRNVNNAEALKGAKLPVNVALKGGDPERQRFINPVQVSWCPHTTLKHIHSETKRENLD